MAAVFTCSILCCVTITLTRGDMSHLQTENRITWTVTCSMLTRASRTVRPGAGDVRFGRRSVVISLTCYISEWLTCLSPVILSPEPSDLRLSWQATPVQQPSFATCVQRITHFFQPSAYWLKHTSLVPCVPLRGGWSVAGGAWLLLQVRGTDSKSAASIKLTQCR